MRHQKASPCQKLGSGSKSITTQDGERRQCSVWHYKNSLTVGIFYALAALIVATKGSADGHKRRGARTGNRTCRFARADHSSGVGHGTRLAGCGGIAWRGQL